jgi:hypothetical protein
LDELRAVHAADPDGWLACLNEALRVSGLSVSEVHERLAQFGELLAGVRGRGARSPSDSTLLRDLEPAMTEAATAVCEAIEPLVAPEVRRLISDLAHFDPERRRRACRALAELGAAAREATEALIQCAERWTGVRPNCVGEALGRIAREDPETLDALRLLLLTPDDAVQIVACTGLREAGPTAGPALDELLSLVETTADCGAQLHLAAAEAAACVAPGDERVVRRLLDSWRLHGQDEYFRPTLVALIAKQVSWPNLIAPVLVDALVDTGWYDGRHVAPHAMRAFDEIGDRLAGAVPLLEGRLSAWAAGADGPEIALRIVRALRAIGPPASPALPLLQSIEAKQRPLELVQAARDAIRNIRKITVPRS